MPSAIILSLLDSVLKIVTLAMEGQTPEQRKIIWDWYIADVRWWRRLLKIDEPGPTQ